MSGRGRIIQAIGLGCCLTMTLVSCAGTGGAPRVAVSPSPSGTEQTQAPSLPPVDPITQFATDRLATMTLRDKVASLLMLRYPGTDAHAVRSFVDAYHPGGMILMGDNIPTPNSGLAPLTTAINPDPQLPILIATDQEGGIVKRIPEDTTPSAAQLRSQPPEAARSAFATRAALLKSLGVSVNLGIIADVTANKNSFIYPRILGTTPAESAARVSAAVLGEHGTVYSTLKHFPGHGATTGDSHTSIPVTGIGYDTWLTEDAPSFRAGIAAGAEFVMMGQLQFDAVDQEPATLSLRWHEILRNDLGFTGAIITDDMIMLQNSGRKEFADPIENAIRALAAGNTMLLYVLVSSPAVSKVDPGALIDGIVAAVHSGRVSETTIDGDALQLLKLRRALVAPVTRR